ncbi:MAG: hypothetical protein ACLUUJ_04875 [Acutalibacteraceae bacterium]
MRGKGAAYLAAPGLPGRFAPQAAGEAVARAVLSMMRSEKV